MQIKIISVPLVGGEQANEELNLLLRSKKVLQVDSQLVSYPTGGYWCFCVKYLDTPPVPLPGEKAAKTDYKQVLDEATFKRFSRLREVRKQLAQQEAVPAYAVFTDEELAEVAKLPELTLASLKTIRGIGGKKVEKYGESLITLLKNDEKSGQPD
jgi:superfamily II DNA helicase RecQ